MARDAVTTKVVEGDVTSVSWSHTCTGTNRLLLVFFAVGVDSTPTVTYNGSSMTQVSKLGPIGTSRYGFLYSIVNPTLGSNTISISNFGSGYFKGYAVSLNNVKQTPLGTVATSSGNSNSESLNVSSGSGELVYDFVFMSGFSGASSYTPGTGQTELLDYNTQSWLSAAGSEKSGSTTTTMSWSSSITVPWGMIGISVKQIISSVKTNWFI